MYYFMVLTDYGFGLTATRAIAIKSDDRDAISRLFSSVMVARFLLFWPGVCFHADHCARNAQNAAQLDRSSIRYLGVLGTFYSPCGCIRACKKCSTSPCAT